MSTHLQAHDLIERLRARYAPPSYAFFTEVGDDPQRSRSADGLAIGMWRSRGLEILGFEVKVSRGDWLKELRTPSKADRIGRCCDRWYLVVSDAALVKDDELPDAWGMLVPKGDGLLEKVKAPKLEARMEMSRPMLAAICRAIHKVDPSTVAMQKEYARGRHEMAEQMAGQTEREVSNRTYHLTAQVDELKGAIAGFQKAIGVPVGTRYQSGEIGEAVRLVLAAQRSGAMHSGLGSAIEVLRRNADHLGKIVEAIARVAEQAALTVPAEPVLSPEAQAGGGP